MCVSEGPFIKQVQEVKGSSDLIKMSVTQHVSPQAATVLCNCPWGLALPAFKPELHSQLHLHSSDYRTLDHERQPQRKPTLGLYLMVWLFFFFFHPIGAQQTAGPETTSKAAEETLNGQPIYATEQFHLNHIINAPLQNSQD